MTIDELKERKAVLRRQIAEEDARLARGEGNSMRRAVLYEELLEVNADLRSLQPKRRIGYGCQSGRGDEYGMNERAIADWKQAQQDEEQEGDPRAPLLLALKNSEDVLTDRQFQVLTLAAQGLGATEIGARLGVDKSTVSHTFKRAKARLNAEAEMLEGLISQERCVVDFSDPKVAKAVLAALTEKQAVYLYLYYAEWLSSREIAELLGLKSHSSVIRSIHVGLKNLGVVLGLGPLELQHLEALDTLAFDVYQTLPAEQLLTEEARQTVERIRPRPAPPGPHHKRSGERPRIIIREGSRIMGTKHGGGAARHGKLLTALLERWKQSAKDGADRPQTLWKWLCAVFGVLCKDRRSATSWRRKYRMPTRKSEK